MVDSKLEAGRPARSRTLLPGVARRVHLLGAGGAGLSGAARILLAHGHELSAHDLAESEHVTALRALGVEVQVSQRPGRLPEGVELVVRSAAVPDDDPQVADAQERGIPVVKYAQLLGRLAPAERTLAIAGTHGKTTTSWIAYHALRGLDELDAELRPGASRSGALVGGICRNLGTNAIVPDADGWFAVEACEYDRSFLQLAPRGAVITNVEADHLDYYGDLDSIKGAFARFADRIPPDGLLVVGADSSRRVEESARCAVWRLGRDLEYDLLGERAGCFSFRLRGPTFELDRVQLGVPGEFNVENAALALGLVVGLVAPARELDPDAAARAAGRSLENFIGCQRRFEPWGTVDSIEIVHDYAHHPTEVRVTLEAARRALPGRSLHVLFQPHQYSRTARFLEDFVESLRFADRVVVADVYGARAHIDGDHAAGAADIAAGLLARGVRAVAPGDLAASITCFADGLPENAAALVLGAGDVGRIRDELLRQVALRRAP